jgi:chromosomal replication initiation ATPase DnaA|tara:strand:+ start:448 stop:801 length:354 start_codon:yes stop_codon:yes gene_type:complete
MKTKTKAKKIKQDPLREFTQEDMRLSPNKVIKDLSEVFKVSKANIAGRCRLESYVRPRHLMAKLLYDSGYSSTEVGRLMDRDHGNVLNSVTRANNMIETDRRIQVALRLLRGKGYRV